MDKKYKILIATGGTGGHIYPAIALARQYEKDSNEVIIVGTGNEICLLYTSPSPRDA